MKRITCAALVALVLIADSAHAAAPKKKAPAPSPSGATRTEHDLLGDKQIPADAYYGVQTLSLIHI